MSINMGKYLHQSATLSPALYDGDGEIQLDAYGMPLYGTPFNIAVRREEKQEEVQSAGWMREKGAKMVSIIQYYTLDAVEVGDRIDGRLVVSKEVYIDGSGNEVGRRCFT